MNNFLRLVAALLISLAAGWIGSFFTTSQILTWYAVLNKPFFNPPDYVFAPVWTTLYVLMGISLFLIWKNKNSKKEKAKSQGIELYFAQLLFNIFWSIVFFGLHSPLAGLIAIVILWILIFKTIKVFSKVDKTAAYLLYPYLFWVSFASILNLFVVLLNR